MHPERVFITGSSGFCGRAVIRAIRQAWPSASILGLDHVSPMSDPPNHFEQCDLTSPGLRELVVEFKPDTIIHLAFVVNPMRDETRMHEINVGGSQRLLAVAAEVKPLRLLISSSATAYGAWPDNPIPMSEQHPLRRRTEFPYADHKFQVETMVKHFAETNRDIAVSWTRPCLIFGPGLSNFMIRLFAVPPVLVLPAGANPEMQFVHQDDVANATIAILNANARGPFNLAPPDSVTIKDIAKMSGRLALPVPFAVCQATTALCWALRLPHLQFPASMWLFIRFPWVVSPDRLMTEIGFRFKYSSDDVIRQLLKSVGRLKP